ncbi:MAG: response regulator [Chitinophagaceae bacterium]
MTEKNIFLLEDDPDIQACIKHILSKRGYTVLAFETVNDFNKQLQAGAPDLFIMDISLPDGNGINVCKELANDDGLSLVPVLLMSADIFNQKKAAQAGIPHFISKPFELSYFLNRVEDLLAA